MSKFTKGQWYSDKSFYNDYHNIKTKNKEGFVACVFMHNDMKADIKPNEAKANLNVILAAPCMYEALELAANILMNSGQKPTPHNNLGIIDRALKKARGES